MDTLGKVQEIIAEKLSIPRETVRPESKAADLEGWDSVNHIMIVTGIEEAFDFKFSLEEIGEMDSVPKLLRAVQDRVAR